VAAAGVLVPQLIHDGVEKLEPLRQPPPAVERPITANSTKREVFLRILLASLLARREL
jgi:hypothetical protein